MTALATPIVARADQRQCMSIADLPHEALSRYDPRRLLRCIPDLLHDRRTSGPRRKQVNMQPAHCGTYERLIAAATSLPAITTAIVHPCDGVLLKTVDAAARRKLIDPILVGPVAKVRMAAERGGIDISSIPLIDAAHSHDAAARAVALVRDDQVDALMTDSLYTDELIGCVAARGTGIRRERRMSHCFIIDLPTNPDPLIVTDAVVNIAPTIEDKADIVQNAMDLARTLRCSALRVGVLSATEATRMVEWRQIARYFNILVVPDRDAGNSLIHHMSHMAGTDAAGIVLGARVPIIVASRADALTSQFASCAAASLSTATRR